MAFEKHLKYKLILDNKGCL